MNCYCHCEVSACDHHLFSVFCFSFSKVLLKFLYLFPNMFMLPAFGVDEINLEHLLLALFEFIVLGFNKIKCSNKSQVEKPINEVPGTGTRTCAHAN